MLHVVSHGGSKLHSVIIEIERLSWSVYPTLQTYRQNNYHSNLFICFVHVGIAEGTAAKSRAFQPALITRPDVVESQPAKVSPVSRAWHVA